MSTLDSVSSSRLTLLPFVFVGSRLRATVGVVRPFPSTMLFASASSNWTLPARKSVVLMFGDVVRDDALAHRQAVERALQRSRRHGIEHGGFPSSGVVGVTAPKRWWPIRGRVVERSVLSWAYRRCRSGV